MPQPPVDADLPTFLLSAGKFVDEAAAVPKMLTLGDLRDRYLQTHANGSLEPKTIVTANVHFRNLIRHFGERMPVTKLTPDLLQGYVGVRGKDHGRRDGPIAPTTIQKDITTLRAGLFLTQPELTEFLEFARTTSKDKHLFPMLAFAAHTGARRSELMRMEIDDVDLKADSAVVRERKKNKGQRTTRRIPISAFLKAVLQDWLDRHPGGQLMLCWKKAPDDQPTPLKAMLA